MQYKLAYRTTEWHRLYAKPIIIRCSTDIQCILQLFVWLLSTNQKHVFDDPLVLEIGSLHSNAPIREVTFYDQQLRV